MPIFWGTRVKGQLHMGPLKFGIDSVPLVGLNWLMLEQYGHLAIKFEVIICFCNSIIL